MIHSVLPFCEDGHLIPGALCRVLKRNDCMVPPLLAYFDPDYISISENGYCSFGYNGKGLLVLQDVERGECDVDFVKKGKYMAKGQVVSVSGGILDALF